MHEGRNNLEHEYEIKGQVLESLTKECDLGVEIRKDLNVDDLCSKAFNKANRMLEYYMSMGVVN